MKFISVEGRDVSQLLRPVSVQIDQNGIRGRRAAQLCDLPLGTALPGRREEERSLLTSYESRVKAVSFDFRKPVVAQHPRFDRGKLQLMRVAEHGKVLRQRRGVARARKTPVVLVLMPALHRTREQPVHSVPLQDRETVHERQIAELGDLPSAFLLRRRRHDGSFPGIIGRIELPGREKLSVASRHLFHGHDAAGAVPYGLQDLPVLREQIAGILLFRRDKETRLSFVLEPRDSVAFGQPGDDLLFHFHLKILFSLFLLCLLRRPCSSQNSSALRRYSSLLYP